MLLVDANNYKKDLLGIKSLAKVGKYYVFSDSHEKSLSGLNARKIPDNVKFPLSYKSDIDVARNKDTVNKIFKQDFTTIAGPCSAESEGQVFETAKFLKQMGINNFRAGCFKPRTNAYSFQGLGKDGLKLCRLACDHYEMNFVSEVKDLSNLDDVIEFADVVQVGSKCMYDVGVLKELGQNNKPILLKRHFGATLREFVQACDFILCEGNEQIILCERGIRTFENDTRFSLDSSGIEWLKQNSWLPIIGDPSHAMGLSYGVSGLSLSMIAQGIEGLIIEVHPEPKIAKSDASQQLNFHEFGNLYPKIIKLRLFMKELLGE